MGTATATGACIAMDSVTCCLGHIRPPSLYCWLRVSTFTAGSNRVKASFKMACVQVPQAAADEKRTAAQGIDLTAGQAGRA